MPTTIATPSNANTKVRFNEQYVSAGLNQKTAGPIPDGIIRGGILETTGAGLNVQINVDPVTGDSLYTYTTPTGFQLTHRESGIRVLNLAALAGQTVYIALYALYAVGVPTVVEWRAYTEAELFGGGPVAEANYVVIVGRVVVPGVGPIPAANATYKRARRAWKATAAGMRPWKQIVQNGSFESGVTAISAGTLNAIAGYRCEEVSSAAISVVAGASQHGAFYLNVAISAGADIGRIGPGQFALANPFSTGILPVTLGQLIDVSFYLEGVTVPAYTINTSGVRLIVEFYSAAGALLATELVASDPAVQVGSFSWTRLDRIFAAPAAGYMRWYLECGNDAGACTWHVDDISIFLEPRGGDRNDDFLTRPRATVSALDLVPFDLSTLQTTMERVVRLTAQSVGGSSVGFKISKAESITALRWLSSFIFDATFSPTESTAGLLGQVGAVTGDYTLLHKYSITSGADQFVRMYAASSNQFGYVITWNASWNGTLWARDLIGRPAMKVMIGNDFPITDDPTYFRIQHMNDPAPPTWADNSWDRNVSLRANAAGDLEYTTKVRRKRFFNIQEVMNFNWSAFGQSVVALGGAGFTNYMTHSGLGQIWFPIVDMVPHGSDVIDFQIGFQATGGTSVNPLALFLIRTQPDTVTSPLNVIAGQTTTVASYSHTPAQPVTEHTKLTLGSGLPHTVDYENYNYQLFYEGALQGGGNAILSYAQITYDDPGPGGR